MLIRFQTPIPGRPDPIDGYSAVVSDLFHRTLGRGLEIGASRTVPHTADGSIRRFEFQSVHTFRSNQPWSKNLEATNNLEIVDCIVTNLIANWITIYWVYSFARICYHPFDCSYLVWLSALACRLNHAVFVNVICIKCWCTVNIQCWAWDCWLASVTELQLVLLNPKLVEGAPDKSWVVCTIQIQSMHSTSLNRLDLAERFCTVHYATSYEICPYPPQLGYING